MFVHQLAYISLLQIVYLSHLAQCIVMNRDSRWDPTRTLHVGYLLFTGWEPLDVFGPLDILYQLSSSYNLSLSTIAVKQGPVNARPPPHRMDPSGPIESYDYMLNPTLIATHSFSDAPPLDVIIVPGGIGDFALESWNDTNMEVFLAQRFNQTSHILSVCTGAVTLARAGLLSGRNATTNKSAWAWATKPEHGTNITWVPSARWVQDGKIWTSSGVAAGMDMMYAFLKYLYGGNKVDEVINGIEYAPHVDSTWDPFSVVYDVPGADKNHSLVDCVEPIRIIS